jgi:stearoyl-CoA 9-desaturase NADPH oxidoreductase
VVQLGQAFGDMALPSHPHQPVLLLAGGSGITPLMAMLRALAARPLPAPLTLLYSARTRAELCFVDELRALAAAQPNFRVRFFLTRDAAQAPDEHAGRIDASAFAALIDAPAAQRVFACGPHAFVEHARALTHAATSFQAEAFTPAPRTHEDHGVATLTLARSGRTVEVARGTSLLEALEGAGLRPAHGCRMGICNTCACGKRSGSVRHLPSGALAHEPASALKLCIHAAAGDLVLDL